MIELGMKKAINNTTVEVTFAEEIEDLKALDFKIEGLEVTNAVVKQTDKKTAVLTTAAQKADTEYTVTVNGKAIGKFKGVSAVVPTKIDVTTSSLQGVIGKEVTLKAQVTVAEGQSKAGIPVTFNIVSDNTNINSKIEVEALTDENGVATYSYTRYYSHNDNVAAYATSKSSVVSNGKVYWADKTQLAVSELTTGNELSNETKKSYKVAGKANTTYYIAIKENLGVTPDKITEVKVQNHGSQNFVTPYELSTGGTPQFATVTTNSNGEGSFTIYGSNLSATPIVYAPESTPTTPATFNYNKLDLQAEAPTVKFSQIDRLAIAVVGEGTADSAEYYTAPGAYNSNSAGGRTYTVTVTDKDGKVAPAGTVAYVSFADLAGDVYFTTGTANFVKLAKNDIKAITVGKEGKAQFRVAGKGATTYVKPTVFLNTAGDVSPVKLDKADVQQVAEITYFKSPVVTNASLKVTDANGNEITSRTAGEDAFFRYQSVDQNGFPYRPGTYTTTPGSTTIIYVQQVDPVTGVITFVPKEVKVDPITSNNYVLAFDVTSTFGNAEVRNESGTLLTAVQNVGSTKTYHVNSNVNGEAVVRVTSQSTDTVSVNVTGASNILPTQTASVSFTDSTILPTVYTGNAYINDVKEEITFAKTGGGHYQTVSYANATFTDKGVVIDKTKFEQLVGTANYAEVTVTRDANGKYHFDFRATTSTPKPGAPVVNNAPVAKTGLDKLTVNTAANIVLTASALASDVDGDALSFVGNVTSSNSTIATANIVGTDLVIDPVNTANGTTTITVDIKDVNNATVTVAFNVKVVNGSVTGLAKTKVYVAPVNAKPATVTTGSFTGPLAATDEVKITVDGGTPVDVALTGTSTAAQVANAIIAEAIPGLDVSVSGDKVVLASLNATPASGSVAIAVGSTSGATLPAQFTTGTTNGAAAVAEAAAEFEFTLATTLAAGEKLVIGGEEYTLTGATVALQVADLVAKINANSSSAFTAVDAQPKVTLKAKAKNDVALPKVEIK
ncbi:hypothetical protein A9986_07900 [Solibacillus silvestris]|nr:hypothetical protein [Solibacillus silvestris]OBW58858.1 hypothetical protein A9986_07900 [Solibacillus silvestris]